MAIGMRFTDGKGNVVTDSQFNDLDVGISLINSDLTLNDTDFNRTTTAVKGTGNTPINAENVTHTEPLSGADTSSNFGNVTRNESHSGADAISLDIVRKFANANV